TNLTKGFDAEIESGRATYGECERCVHRPVVQARSIQRLVDLRTGVRRIGRVDLTAIGCTNVEIVKRSLVGVLSSNLRTSRSGGCPSVGGRRSVRRVARVFHAKRARENLFGVRSRAERKSTRIARRVFECEALQDFRISRRLEAAVPMNI